MPVIIPHDTALRKKTFVLITLRSNDSRQKELLLGGYAKLLNVEGIGEVLQGVSMQHLDDHSFGRVLTKNTLMYLWDHHNL